MESRDRSTQSNPQFDQGLECYGELGGETAEAAISTVPGLSLLGLVGFRLPLIAKCC